MIDVARQAGAHCIGVNLEPPMNIAQHDEFHHGKAGELLPGLIEKLSIKLTRLGDEWLISQYVVV